MNASYEVASVRAAHRAVVAIAAVVDTHTMVDLRAVVIPAVACSVRIVTGCFSFSIQLSSLFFRTSPCQ